MVKKWCCSGLLLCLLFFMSGCTGDKQQTPSEQKKSAKIPAIEYWQSNNEDEPVLWEQADLNGDGEQETVLIYRVSRNECGMVVITKTPEGFEISQSSRAPLENQIIKIQDIDQQLPLEIIVSGSKQGNYGYGIFRLEENQLIDLFADGMNDCC